MNSQPPASDARPDLLPHADCQPGDRPPKEIPHGRSGSGRRGASEADSMGAESASRGGDALKEIRGELRHIRRLLAEPKPRVDDLVDAAYVAGRTGLKERTVLEGKAGTHKLPRVHLGSENSSRSLVRFPRGAVDKFVADLVHKATNNSQRERSLRLLRRNSKQRRRVS